MASDDYYGDSPNSQPPSSSPAADKPDADESDEQTALLPKALCPNMKVGDTLALKIVAEHEDEYQVSYEQAPEGKEGESEASAKDASPSPMDDMMG